MGIRDVSRTEYAVHGIPTHDEIKMGCLQRIADATETMAKSYTALVADRDRLQRWYNDERASNDRLRRRLAALRGVITRQKRGRR